MHPLTRALRGASLAVVAAIALAGCSGVQPQPRNYGEVTTDGSGYFGNFMFGCTGVEPDSEGRYVDVELQSEDYCRCVFAGLKEKVPFDEVRQFEEDQAEAEDGNDIEVPRNIRNVMDDCAGESRS